MKTAIEPRRDQNFPEWYQQVVKASELAENSPVRGCMVVKPWGYAVWENIQIHFNRIIKRLGVENAYFPLFIPLSYFQKEAEHVEGFATECAVVTHHRLTKDADGQLQPAGPLEEPLIVRPTSEMIIGEMFSKWIESYRDLPIKLNQWANIVRWEMRTRIFLRSAEILWQEGHNAFATREEALEDARKMQRVYADFARDFLALPFITGEKSETERFPGADATFTVEGMMQDGKALQAGTSHFLGQNFSKAQDITFTDESGNIQHVWTTSWGSTTRLIGAMVMTHGDDDGMIMPPRIASSQIAILPVIHKEEMREQIETYCDKLADELRDVNYCHEPLSIYVDKRDMRGGEKTWNWIKKGVPIRIEVGARELEADTLFVKVRTKGPKEAEKIPRASFIESVVSRLDDIQDELLARAIAFREKHTVEIDTKEAFYSHFAKEGTGFVLAHWSRDKEVEKQIKQDLGVTVRCIPDEMGKEEGTCIFTGASSPSKVLFAKAY